MKVEKIQALRINFLKGLYTSCNADPEEDMDMFELGEQLGISFDDILKIVSYLHQDRLISYRGIGPMIGISHAGIKKAEGTIDQSEQLLATNIISIGTMQNSAIQQGSSNSIQNFSLTLENQDKLYFFLQELKKSLDKLGLPSEDRSEVEAEVKTIETQLESPKPKETIIQISSQAILRILEGIVGNLYTQPLINMLHNLF